MGFMHRSVSCLLGFCLPAALCLGQAQTNVPLSQQPSVRKPWTSSRVRGTPEPPPAFRTVRVFPEIKFKNPLLMVRGPQQTRLADRWFVAEQEGRIYSFRDSPEAAQGDFF